MNMKIGEHTLMYTRCLPALHKAQDKAAPPPPTAKGLQQRRDRHLSGRALQVMHGTHTPAHGTTSAHEGSTTTTASKHAHTNTNMHRVGTLCVHPCTTPQPVESCTPNTNACAHTRRPTPPVITMNNSTPHQAVWNSAPTCSAACRDCAAPPNMQASAHDSRVAT
jgi:hypothetical protein